MARIWSQASRNLGRNRRRTIITSIALAFGMMLCIATYAIVDGMSAQMLHSLTKYDLGHVQVHPRKYVEDTDLDATIEDARSIVATAGSEAGVVGAAPRLYGFGLLSATGKSSGVQLVGIDPQLEGAITELKETFVSGAFLKDEPTPWGTRRELSEQEKKEDEALTEAAVENALAELDALDGDSDDAVEAAQLGRAERDSEAADERSRQLALAQSPRPKAALPAVLGDELAEALQVKRGDQLFLSTAAAGGETEAVFVQVAGIFATGTQLLDRNRMYLHIEDLGHLIHQEGEAHEISVVVEDVERASAVAARLERKLGLKETLVRPWDEIRPEVAEMLKMNGVSSAIMVSIILFVAALGVVNTMLMAVFERTRELGVLKAIGMSPWSIVKMMMAETFLLILLGSFAGVTLGLGLDLYLMFHGLDLSGSTDGMTVGNVGINPVIYGVITPSGIVLPVVILVVISMVASLYPAIRAARMQPAVGMRET